MNQYEIAYLLIAGGFFCGAIVASWACYALAEEEPSCAECQIVVVASCAAAMGWPVVLVAFALHQCWSALWRIKKGGAK